MLVAGVAHSGRAQERADSTLTELTFLRGESWMATARRLMLHSCGKRRRGEAAVNVKKYVSRRQVAELCERTVDVLFSDASDAKG